MIDCNWCDKKFKTYSHLKSHVLYWHSIYEWSDEEKANFLMKEFGIPLVFDIYGNFETLGEHLSRLENFGVNISEVLQ